MYSTIVSSNKTLNLKMGPFCYAWLKHKWIVLIVDWVVHLSTHVVPFLRSSLIMYFSFPQMIMTPNKLIVFEILDTTKCCYCCRFQLIHPSWITLLKTNCFFNLMQTLKNRMYENVDKFFPSTRFRTHIENVNQAQFIVQIDSKAKSLATPIYTVTHTHKHS